jgi:antirestriction protein ArdC
LQQQLQPKSKEANMKKDIYQTITDQIIRELEEGVRPWHRPWNAAHLDGRVLLPLRQNGIPYRGVNIITLWMTALAKGYAAPIWMTFRQALALGGGVRKGEKGSLVVYADRITRTETNAESGEESERNIPFLKGYTVFNAEQIDGLPTHYYSKAEPRTEPLPRIERAERFFAATGANIVHGGSQACYVKRTDNIHMPCIDVFRDSENYYATIAHEVTHWTMHETRLDRSFERKRFGDEGYAMEELVAELGSAFLCADLELTPELRADHASYIENWLTVLKGDKRAIFTAASHAQRAADFLHDLQPSADVKEIEAA